MADTRQDGAPGASTRLPGSLEDTDLVLYLTNHL
ncbi:hypothetical protein KIPB_011129, partial [Kipferlia bialata]|eukprot:g11129.t1